jgi:hypothetical protein
LSTAAACVRYTGETAADGIPNLVLPRNPTFVLGGNAYGVGGRSTTMSQCATRDDGLDGLGTFGWNWTRGETAAPCVVPGTCKAPDCFADFSLASLNHGVSPWGGGSAGHVLPADISRLAALLVRQHAAECTCWYVGMLRGVPAGTSACCRVFRRAWHVETSGKVVLTCTGVCWYAL